MTIAGSAIIALILIVAMCIAIVMTVTIMLTIVPVIASIMMAIVLVVISIVVAIVVSIAIAMMMATIVVMNYCRGIYHVVVSMVMITSAYLIISVVKVRMEPAVIITNVTDQRIVIRGHSSQNTSAKTHIDSYEYIASLQNNFEIICSSV